MRSRPRKAFTLVEVVVVIALIVLLSALVLGVGTAVVKSSENRQTALLLTQLDGAAKEWRLAADRDIELPEPVAADLDDLENPAGNLKLYLNRYFHLLQRPAALRDTLAKLNPDFATRFTYQDPNEPGHSLETLVVVDAWDTTVLVVSAGRSWVPGDPLPADKDGTIRTALETILGFARNRQPYFVSAGSDGRFGDIAPATGPAFDQTRDNLYSQSPEFQ